MHPACAVASSTLGEMRRRATSLAALLLVTSLLVPAIVASPAGAITGQGVFPFGDSAALGSTETMDLRAPVVGMVAYPRGDGYWIAAGDGGVFAFGEARFHGSAGRLNLVQPVVGMAATRTGSGYWLVARDGGVFSYGDARFHGSTGSMALNEPIVGMAPAPDGAGYWLVAEDGGVFAFGSARFHGSAQEALPLRPAVGMAASPSGKGYWIVTDDGGVFAFGSARFHGSAAELDLQQPVTGIAATRSGVGYWLVAGDGGVFAYGDAEWHGSASARRGRKSAGVVPTPSGRGYWVYETVAVPPSPPLPAGSGRGRRIVYSVSGQRVWLVESGELVVKSHLVSGRRGIPSPGTYRVFSKSRYSSSGSLVLEYMTRFAWGSSLAIGFHAIPYYPGGRSIQSESELGQYRSAGCVRQRLSDAAYLWDFAPVGTAVVVTR